MLDDHLHGFINTWHQLVRPCVAICFDQNAFLQAMWQYKTVNKLQLHTTVPLD